MTDIILHHYDLSPFAEKARLMFGIKGLAWKGVQIPLVMPKPDLMPLTGGYRRTPVMQIGADIFCDTRLIAEELERRFDGPSLMAGGLGLANVVSGFAEEKLFWAVAGLVVGTNADRFPMAFHEDRAKMRGGSGNVNLDKLKAASGMQVEQLRPQLGWAADLFRDGRSFLAGETAGLADLTLHHPLWFLKNSGGEAAAVLDDYPALPAFMARVEAIGHGEMSEMSAAEALDVATNASPEAGRGVAANAEGWKAGDAMAVMPTDYARDPVVGELTGYGGNAITVLRNDDRVGAVAVHFPRVGYALRRAG
ncbi:MAG: glutathione S-transferase family protein [Minwuia sp.]|uniref:glutathione S-transferase family protein n=1 Tax=Minwuia sp. TaxID=2493630 RepID=UPI003A8B1822